MATFKACLILLVPLLGYFKAYGNAIRIMEAIKPDCGFACRKLCPTIDADMELYPTISEFGCHIECSMPCKRGIHNSEISDVQSRVQAMSQDFTHYDLNGDNLISTEEFSRAENLPLGEVKDAFKWADTNGDYMLGLYEFEAAPFHFASDSDTRPP